jgi:type I restriction enzyme S subunit
LRITDIQNGAVDWESVPWCLASSREVNSARLIPGDIVFARTGATTGKSFLVRDCPDDAVFASYLIRLRLSGGVLPEYINHFFQTPDYWQQISRNANGAAQPGVNASVLKTLEAPIPPIHEQRRIVTILDQADTLRAQRREMLAELEKLPQSVFVEMFGDPALNRYQWPKMPLGQTAEKFSDGPFGSNLKSSHYTESGVRVIRLQNIGIGELVDHDRAFISEEHFQSLRKHECRPGDVLIATLGDPNLRACIQPVSIEVALNKADCTKPLAR